MSMILTKLHGINYWNKEEARVVRQEHSGASVRHDGKLYGLIVMMYVCMYTMIFLSELSNDPL